jgi:MoaA/NifB/PqqE/SkfB family radical SAM enzyme
MTVKEQFETYKIHQMQLDPYGVCNARCWFCPVKYKGNPTHGKEAMKPELLRKIIENIIEEREKPDGLVSKNFGGFYTGHYNEILLYPYFEELLKICQEHRLCFMVLSNGIPLTPEKVDLIVKYEGVVNGICLNIPAFDAETWSKRSGINIKQFDKLIANVHYAMGKLPNMVMNKSFSIQINGSNNNSFSDRGGWLDKGPEFPTDIDLDPTTGELATQVKKARELFVGLQIFDVPSLIDRAGLLDHIMTNKEAIKRNLQRGDETKKVVGCGNGREVGGRPIGWIHINAAGKVFLCCNDYDMEIQFGDFKIQKLKDFWGNDEHIKKIEESYNTICRGCASAIFE